MRRHRPCPARRPALAPAALALLLSLVVHAAALAVLARFGGEGEAPPRALVVELVSAEAVREAGSPRSREAGVRDETAAREATAPPSDAASAARAARAPASAVEEAVLPGAAAAEAEPASPPAVRAQAKPARAPEASAASLRDTGERARPPAARERRAAQPAPRATESQRSGSTAQPPAEPAAAAGPGELGTGGHGTGDEAVIEPPGFAPGSRDNPLPRYPSAARRRGIEGTVLLEVLVSPQGQAEQVEILRSSGSSLLDEAAREAILRWRFTPARRGAVAVPGRITVPITFRLLATEQAALP